MNAIEVSAWHRDRAERLLTEAKKLQAEAKIHQEMAEKIANERKELLLGGFTPAPESNGTKGSVTIEQVRSYLQHSGGRAVHLAKHFKVAPSEIERLIKAPSSGVVVQPRGWLRLQNEKDF